MHACVIAGSWPVGCSEIKAGSRFSVRALAPRACDGCVRGIQDTGRSTGKVVILIVPHGPEECAQSGQAETDRHRDEEEIAHVPPLSDGRKAIQACQVP